MSAMALSSPGLTASSGCCAASRTRFMRCANRRLAARLAKITLPVTENSSSPNR